MKAVLIVLGVLLLIVVMCRGSLVFFRAGMSWPRKKTKAIAGA